MRIPTTVWYPTPGLTADDPAGSKKALYVADNYDADFAFTGNLDREEAVLKARAAAQEDMDLTSYSFHLEELDLTSYSFHLGELDLTSYSFPLEEEMEQGDGSMGNAYGVEDVYALSYSYHQEY